MVAKFSDEEQRRLIKIRLSEKYDILFKKYKTKAYKTRDTWSKLALELGQEGKGDAVKTKFNDLLKQFRRKKLDVSKSGASPPKWKFYIDFVEASSKGTELVADIAYDSGLLNNHEEIKKAELVEESPKRQK